METRVFVSGNFNVLHPGHLRLLRFAKECGTRLIVGVFSDRLAAGAAHISQELRLEGIKANSWVDEAFLIDEPLPELLQRLRPEIVVKGKEHEKQKNIELETLQQYGGQLLFSSGETTFSSLDLLHREFSATPTRTIELPHEYLRWHKIDLSTLKQRVKQFSQLKVCVIGDLIVDEYVMCQPLGMSQEDPTIVVTPIDTMRFVGGAGIVAAHAAGLGAQVQFVSLAGADATQDFALEKLSAYGVKARILTDSTRPTTLKQRYRAQGKTLLRVSHLHQNALPGALQPAFLAEVEAALQDSQVLVFSDFNYGCLAQPIVEQIIAWGKQRGLLMAADSQSSSQTGDISRFRGMDLITPTEREARLSTRNREDGLVVMVEQLRQQAQARNILLKLGEEGVLVHASNPHDSDWLTDRVAALNTAPKDVAGAGDSLLIASAMALACGSSIWESAALGSLAAAVQVGRVGNTPLKAEELLQEFD